MSEDPRRTLVDVRRRHRNVLASVRRELPDDLVDEALKRLGNVALVIAVVLGVNLAFTTLFAEMLEKQLIGDEIPYVARLFFVLASFAMFVIVRFSSLSRRVKSDIGMFYEVAGAVSIVAIEEGILTALGVPIGTTSMVVVWILILRMLVPVSTLRAVVTTGAASLAALLAWLWFARTDPSIDLYLFSGMIKTTAFTALAAIFASRVVYQLGTKVNEARELGVYQLETRLGQGGMGEVWRASHRMLRRPAAIKLIRPDALGTGPDDSHSATQERFEREAQATASLRSPHTVRLYDYGKTEAGSFYYVMELLDGVDMDTLVRTYGPVLAERAVCLLDQVCHSLADAHAEGMIHRDIKPANIFVCKLGQDHDFVKVLDFGLVKETRSSEDSGLTRENHAPGTPAFMAPESATRQHAVAAASDIYQLGCVGYWLLTGELVFEGDTPLALISKHIAEEPVPLSERTEIQVPEALEQLIMACLAKDPADRPASAEVVRQRLAEIEFEHPWTPERRRRWWEKHRPTTG